MSTRVIWIIIVRVLGLMLLIDLFNLIPSSAIGSIYNPSVDTILPFTLTIAFFLSFIRLIFVKTEWIISKLKLNANIENERLEGTIDKNSIYTLAIIIVGGILLIDAISNIAYEVTSYINTRRFIESYMDDSSINSAYLVFYGVKAAIGYLLIANVQKVLKYILPKPE